LEIMTVGVKASGIRCISCGERTSRKC
jgi:hypothetical protein